MKKSIENIDPVPICKRMQELRKRLGYDNKSKFARKLDLSPQAYQNYESDRIPPSDVIYKIALKFKRDVDFVWLFTGHEPQSVSPQPPPLNSVLLKRVIEGVENHLGEIDKSLSPDLKSRLIALLFDYYSETGERVDKKKVAYYLKLVA